MLHFWIVCLCCCLSSMITAKEEANHVNMEEKGAEAPQKNSQEFVLKPGANWQDKEPAYYRSPPSATKGVRGIKFPYTIWYNQFVWDEAPPLNVHAERSFRIEDKNAYAIIVTSPQPIDLEDLGGIVIQNAKENGFEEVKVLSIEKRHVNGHDVVFVHWEATIQGISVEFLSYLYSDHRGSIYIHTYTPTALFKKNDRDMEELLNGFTPDKKNSTGSDDE